MPGFAYFLWWFAQAMSFVMISIWGMRLTLFLVQRNVVQEFMVEDFRYVQIRKGWEGYPYGDILFPSACYFFQGFLQVCAGVW